MSENTKGEWVKYEKQPGKWKNTDTSYTRLCNDLEEHQDTGWSLINFAEYIYGAIPPYTGLPVSDIYIYYVNEENQKREPKLFLAAHRDNHGIIVDVFGLKKETKSYLDSYEPDAKYLPIILEKLHELHAQKWIIEKYEKKLFKYQSLIKADKDSIETSEDILTIYRNLSKTEIIISRGIINERNVQNDYNSLNEKDKIAFIEILYNLNPNDKGKIAMFSFIKDLFLSIKDINILKKTVSYTRLLCLLLAPEDYRKNKEIILKILSDYDIKTSDILGLDAISEDLQIDIDVIHALIRTQPDKINEILNYYANNNKLFEAKLNDKNYMLNLLDMYLKSIISNPSYIKEKFVPLNLLWFFRLDFLDNIESKLLCGPFQTLEEEEMKRIAYNELKLERTRQKGRI